MPAFLNSPVYILTVLTGIVFLSEWILKYKLFRRFGAALMAIIFGAIVANVGLLPASSNPVYDNIFDYIAPAALFLLLLDVNLTELKNVGWPMLVLFLVGSAGTAAGVVVAVSIIPDSGIFEGAYAPLAGMLAGTYTGGSINFNAVALHYDVVEKGLVYTSAIAVDNIATAVWMFVTITIPGILQGKKHLRKKPVSTSEKPAKPISLKDLSLLIFITIAALWISVELAGFFSRFGVEVPMIIIITTIALVLAQFRMIHQLPGNQKFGSWLVFLFLAVIGAFCDLGAFSRAGTLAMVILGFVLIIFTVHALFMWAASKAIPSDWDEIAIASQANIGGSTTAMALAQNFERHELVLPAIIIGTLGNALGTYIGFLVAAFV